MIFIYMCCTVFLPPVTNVQVTYLGIENFILPAVSLWNPLVLYRSVVDIKCPDCSSNCNVKHWNDGSCPSQQPRVLHILVLLAGATYICTNGHICLSHNARILKLFPPEIEIPFCLLHRTGLTTEFVEMCHSFVSKGMNFFNIESLIIERR